jgi:hypothetical protein
MSLKLNVFFVLSPAHTVSHCSPQPNPTKIISSPRVTKQASGRQRGAERSLHPRTMAHQSSLGLGGRRHGPWHHRPPSRLRIVPSIPPPSSLTACTQIRRCRRTGAGGARLQTVGGRGRRTDEVTRSRTSFEVVPRELIVFGL